jgi:hypothetical protein
MNDLLEAQLAGRLHDLAEGVALPRATPEDDVRRGRGRLRRNRALGVAGSAATLAVLAGAGFAVAGPPTADRAVTPPAVTSPAERPAAKGEQQPRLTDEIAGLAADQPAKGGRDAFTLAEMAAMSEVFEDRLPAGGVQWLGIGRATSWRSSGATDCPAGWTCEDVAVRGAPRARWASSGPVRQLVADLPSGVLVLSVNAADERPAELAYRTD